MSVIGTSFVCSLQEGVRPRETALGDAPFGTGVRSVGMGIPAGSVGRGKGPPTGGCGEFGSSDPVSRLGCEGSSGEEGGVSFQGGEPGEKRNGGRTNGP